MQPFTFFLKNEKRKFYDRIAIFIFLLNGLAIIYLFLGQNATLKTDPVRILVALLVFPSIFVYLFSKEEKWKFIAYVIAAIMICFFWIWTGHWWISTLLVILFGLYEISKRPLKLVVAEDLIEYPSFPGRHIHWNELNNVVLKDELLTLDFRNNKIVQQLIEPTPVAFNEKE